MEVSYGVAFITVKFLVICVPPLLAKNHEFE